jgi:hypothetical protein
LNDDARHEHSRRAPGEALSREDFPPASAHMRIRFAWLLPIGLLSGLQTGRAQDGRRVPTSAVGFRVTPLSVGEGQLSVWYPAAGAFGPGSMTIGGYIDAEHTAAGSSSAAAQFRTGVARMYGSARGLPSGPRSSGAAGAQELVACSRSADSAVANALGGTKRSRRRRGALLGTVADPAQPQRLARAAARTFDGRAARCRNRRRLTRSPCRDRA